MLGAYRGAVPVTFLAHQLPVLPIARRWRHADGVTLVVGSMAPDMAYVLDGTPLRVWAHGLPGSVTFGLPITLAVSWLIVTVISPVLWDHLPQAGPFHLRDYRGLAAHRFVFPWAGVSSLAGIASHIALDHFTHRWGWFAQNVGWYDTIVVDGFLGRDWTFFRVLQYVGHIVGSGLCLVLLWRFGRVRWMAAAAAKVAPFATTPRTTLTLAGGTLAGFGVGVIVTVVTAAGNATDILRVAATTFAGLAITSAATTFASNGPRGSNR